MSGGGAPKPMIARPSGPLRGATVIPGDKSISHRSLIFGALAVGETRIEGLLEGGDVLDTAKAMRLLGAEVERTGPGAWRVQGVGVGGLSEPEDVIDYGNSGTGVRLCMGVVATHDIAATFTGDASLRRRPMGRVTEPLAAFGAQAYGRAGGRLPLTMVGCADPAPVSYRLPVASAQVKSAVLLAGLNTPGITEVIEPEATRDHTERMLMGFGAELEIEPMVEGGRRIRLTGQPELKGQSIRVPSDPSSAAFPLVAGLLVEGSEVSVQAIGLNPTRAGLYETLREMGADLTFANERLEGGEPVADLTARFSTLQAVSPPAERAPSMIDEYPILAVAAAFAEGTSVFEGLAELRVKETDRLAAVARGLAQCGVSIEERPDALVVHGLGPKGVVGPEQGAAPIATELDHRIAMSFAVMGMAAQRPTVLDDGAPIATSFPTFAELMRGLGAEIEEDVALEAAS